MPGVLLREGVSRGPAPTLEVLLIRSKGAVQQSSDLLPYIPQFRSFFAPLPTNVSGMDLKVFKIPLDGVECITKTTVKVNRPARPSNFREAVYASSRLTQTPH